ncbi:hypothetical protein DTL21_13975 [Bremerella cremea]|uniref:Uncharacterized protein n=1 Tax=Blastopirellula marina TaxID=124 RepID=A0A2S8FRY4_9BACT|nr:MULTISPECIES: hypothetical protein [Pirellulaceae]PQO34614.1 hypothetical protein C5Y83_13970 [Blastopirellula marina]RCS47111.1 hypothetical protein DTL21_13975 [Bremerella cremea]
MDTNDIKKLCLKYVYGAALTDAERAVVDDYAKATDGQAYLQECREMKHLLTNVADVKVRPIDHEAMIENFERTVRQSFDRTVFRPVKETYGLPVILGLLACSLIFFDGWSILNAVLLGVSALWLIVTWFQRYYMAKILSKPDLYEYAMTSRRRSDRIIKSLPGRLLIALFVGLAIAVTAFIAYWGYQEFGFLFPAIMVFLLVETLVIIIYQIRQQKRSNREVWDWWEEEIKE